MLSILYNNFNKQQYHTLTPAKAEQLALDKEKDIADSARKNSHNSSKSRITIKADSDLSVYKLKKMLSQGKSRQSPSHYVENAHSVVMLLINETHFSESLAIQNNKTGFRPKQTWIAGKIKRHVNTVQRVLKDLERVGLIERGALLYTKEQRLFKRKIRLLSLTNLFLELFDIIDEYASGIQYNNKINRLSVESASLVPI